MASVSGTLAMAMGLGGACVSTPYPFAVGELVDGAGILVDFEDVGGLANAIVFLLDNDTYALEMGKLAAGRTTKWKDVGKLYINLAASL